MPPDLPKKPQYRLAFQQASSGFPLLSRTLETVRGSPSGRFRDALVAVPGLALLGAPSKLWQEQSRNYARSMLLRMKQRWPWMWNESLEQAFQQAGNKVSALRYKLRRLVRTIRGPSKFQREFLPVLSEKELVNLRQKLKGMQERWAQERILRQRGEVIDGKKEPSVVLSQATISSQLLAESVSIDLNKLAQLKTDIQSTGTERALSIRNLVTTFKTVSTIMPQLPFLIGTLAQDFIFQREQEREKRRKKVEERGEEEESKTDLAESVFTSAPHWKRQIGGATVSKMTVDARTRFCAQTLREAVEDDYKLLRRLEIFCAHLHQFPYAKGVAVRENAIGDLLYIRQKTENEAVAVQVREALDLLGYYDPVPGRGIRILCLDGGGMRGMVACEVLAVIEKTTGKKIHELFDFMCGVSTGAIILAFLAFHKKSVKEIEETYTELGHRVFSQNLFGGTRGWVMSHSYYNTQLYEETLRTFVGSMRMNETLRSEKTPKAAIISTLVSGHRISPYVFRNYHYPYRTQSFYRGSPGYAIWEAVRASSAAPGYFDEFCINDNIHHDGGIMTNNASIIAIHEAQKLWPGEKVTCLVSLGMGRYERPISLEDEAKPKALSLAQKFSRVVDAATDTEINHVTLEGSVARERLLPVLTPFLSEYFPLDEVRPEKIAAMREDTRMYLRKKSQQNPGGMLYTTETKKANRST